MGYGEIISAMALGLAILAVYVKTKIDIAKLEVEVENLKDNHVDNKEDICKLFDKLDEIKMLIISKLK